MLNVKAINKIEASLIQYFEKILIELLLIFLFMSYMFCGDNIFSLTFGNIKLLKINSEFFLISISLLILESDRIKIVEYNLQAPPMINCGIILYKEKFWEMN